MDAHKQFRRNVLRLLDTMTGAREIQQYLQRFSELDAKRFAVVKVGGVVLREDCAALASSLSFLQQVGLTPIVVHGAGPQLDDELNSAGIANRTIGGLRMTTPPALAIVRRVAQTENLKLVDTMQRLGTRASSLVGGVFEAAFIDRAKYAMVGCVTRVNLAAIEAVINAGAIPVIASLGETRQGQILNVNADFAAQALARALQPYKIVFLTGAGGLLDGDGQTIGSINLASDYDRLMREPWLHSGMRLKLEQIKTLLDALPPTSSVSITRPSELAKELFTHRGSGTLVRRGETLREARAWEQVDRGLLRALIESSFKRKLHPDYFARTCLHRAWVSENYRAALILTLEDGVPYLDKFAVATDAQGEGLGRSLWKAMRAETPALFWRSRRGNPANDFYFAEADGSLKVEPWTTFWYGLPTFAAIKDCVNHCRERAATLEAHDD